MTSLSTAVAKTETGPRAMVAQYKDSFAQVLPTHVRADVFVRVAQGALKRGKMQGKRYELEIAAENNPGVFLASLLDAARLGLEPGTEQYYLTPRKVKVNGQYQTEILGIVGYQGHIELMYRAGAVASVVAECVYSKDKFQFRPGVDERPVHEIDWDAEDRGELRLVYAYAVMKDGATSKVVVLNREAIKKIKASSQGAGNEYSPWVKHEAAMWLKSSVRQLSKWVPTSAEYRREVARTEAAVAEQPAAPEAFAPPMLAGDEPVDITDTYIDGEVVESEAAADFTPRPDFDDEGWLAGGEPR